MPSVEVNSVQSALRITLVLDPDTQLNVRGFTQNEGNRVPITHESDPNTILGQCGTVCEKKIAAIAFVVLEKVKEDPFLRENSALQKVSDESAPLTNDEDDIILHILRKLFFGEVLERIVSDKKKIKEKADQIQQNAKRRLLADGTIVRGNVTGQTEEPSIEAKRPIAASDDQATKRALQLAATERRISHQNSPTAKPKTFARKAQRSSSADGAVPIQTSQPETFIPNRINSVAPTTSAAVSAQALQAAAPRDNSINASTAAASPAASSTHRAGISIKMLNDIDPMRIHLILEVTSNENENPQIEVSSEAIENISKYHEVHDSSHLMQIARIVQFTLKTLSNMLKEDPDNIKFSAVRFAHSTLMTHTYAADKMEKDSFNMVCHNIICLIRDWYIGKEAAINFSCNHSREFIALADSISQSPQTVHAPDQPSAARPTSTTPAQPNTPQPYPATTEEDPTITPIPITIANSAVPSIQLFNSNGLFVAMAVGLSIKATLTNDTRKDKVEIQIELDWITTDYTLVINNPTLRCDKDLMGVALIISLTLKCLFDNHCKALRSAYDPKKCENIPSFEIEDPFKAMRRVVSWYIGEPNVETFLKDELSGIAEEASAFLLSLDFQFTNNPIQSIKSQHSMVPCLELFNGKDPNLALQIGLYLSTNSTCDAPNNKPTFVIPLICISPHHGGITSHPILLGNYNLIETALIIHLTLKLLFNEYWSLLASEGARQKFGSQQYIYVVKDPYKLVNLIVGWYISKEDTQEFTNDKSKNIIETAENMLDKRGITPNTIADQPNTAQPKGNGHPHPPSNNGTSAENKLDKFVRIPIPPDGLCAYTSVSVIKIVLDIIQHQQSITTEKFLDRVKKLRSETQTTLAFYLWQNPDDARSTYRDIVLDSVKDIARSEQSTWETLIKEGLSYRGVTQLNDRDLTLFVSDVINSFQKLQRQEAVDAFNDHFVGRCARLILSGLWLSLASMKILCYHNFQEEVPVVLSECLQVCQATLFVGWAGNHYTAFLDKETYQQYATLLHKHLESLRHLPFDNPSNKSLPVQSALEQPERKDGILMFSVFSEISETDKELAKLVCRTKCSF